MPSSVSVPVEFPEAQRLADIDGMLHDLRVCRDCCQKYLALISRKDRGEHDHFLSEVMVTTAFTKYGRCFKGGVRVKTRNEVLEQLSEEDLEVHQVIIDIRDKHVSHSVNEFERPRAMVSLRGDSPERELTGVSIGTTYIMAPDAVVFHNWIILIDKLWDWLREESKKESRKLTEIAKERFSLDELYDRIGSGKRHEVRFGDIPKTRKGV